MALFPFSCARPGAFLKWDGMNFYGYEGKYELGKEPLGTFRKILWRDLRTVAGAKRRAAKLYGDNYRMFTFTNLYDEGTYQEVT